MRGVVIVEGDRLVALYDNVRYVFTKRNEFSVRKSVIRGIVQQHRLRYSAELKIAESLIQILNREVRLLIPQILEDLRSSKFFPLYSWPSVGIAVVEMFGVEFPLEIYVCYPISHPMPRDRLEALLPVEYDEFAVCVEPIAPLREWVKGWSIVRVPTLKDLGRVSLSRAGDTYALIVKRGGLYYVSTCKACSDPLGGLTLECPVLNCRVYRRDLALRATRRLLSRRRAVRPRAYVLRSATGGAP